MDSAGAQCLCYQGKGMAQEWIAIIMKGQEKTPCNSGLLLPPPLLVPMLPILAFSHLPPHLLLHIPLLPCVALLVLRLVVQPLLLLPHPLVPYALLSLLPLYPSPLFLCLPLPLLSHLVRVALHETKQVHLDQNQNQNQSINTSIGEAAEVEAEVQREEEERRVERVRAARI